MSTTASDTTNVIPTTAGAFVTTSVVSSTLSKAQTFLTTLLTEASSAASYLTTAKEGWPSSASIQSTEPAGISTAAPSTTTPAPGMTDGELALIISGSILGGILLVVLIAVCCHCYCRKNSTETSAKAMIRVRATKLARSFWRKRAEQTYEETVNKSEANVYDQVVTSNHGNGVPKSTSQQKLIHNGSFEQISLAETGSRPATYIQPTGGATNTRPDTYVQVGADPDCMTGGAANDDNVRARPDTYVKVVDDPHYVNAGMVSSKRKS